MSATETKSTSGSTPGSTAGDDDAWSSGADFDTLEKEASKIFALWELTGGEPPAAPAVSEPEPDETWSAGDATVSTQPDPLPVMPEAAPVASPAGANGAGLHGDPKKTLPIGSVAPVVAATAAASEAVAAPAPAPTAPAAEPPSVEVAAVTAAPEPAPPVRRSNAPEPPIDSIIIAPELRDSITSIDAKPLRLEPPQRPSNAPDTVIDAKPLPRPPQPIVEDPIALPTSRSPLPMIIGAAVALLLAGGVGYMAFARPASEPAAPTAAVAPPTSPVAAIAAVAPPVTPTTPVAVEAAAVVPAAAAVAPVPPPVMHALRLTVEPASASVTVDGLPVTLPYDTSFAAGSSHRVAATADGYETATRDVEMTADAEVRLTLAPVVVPEPPAPEPAAEATEEPRERSSSRRRIGSRIARRRSGDHASSGAASSGGRSGSGTFVTESPY